MTTPLFRDDAYLQQAQARVRAITPEGGVVLDQSIFYPTGGGQPGDSGEISWEGGAVRIAATVKGEEGTIVLVPEEGGTLPAPGMVVEQRIDWARRHRLMRMHTALHLLSVVIPLPVSGGAIGEAKGRLDFDMPEPPEDPAALEAELNRLIAADLPVGTEWITEAELDAQPGLVKTMSVAPPRGAGRVRLVRIGQGAATVDLQPCGGTHVARTGEIGHASLGKIEKKGRQNRRVSLLLSD
ncbi:MAG: alanyl-tRNA editing protein [Limimaricola sp.]|uniref:alanyl-tRNA editing protein n=1 Tax=Limimaricola sp. TaxID=2211665 RepID=UPI001DFDDE84|nr:alanyl-tRNA editing protein [Limimaricola sp.]MBI1416861.1 alanyl-tRNA editing protein [Limimaricola sp.]